MDNLFEILTATYTGRDAELLALLTKEKLERIRKKYKGLMEQWKLLGVDDTLQLIFDA